MLAPIAENAAKRSLDETRVFFALSSKIHSTGQVPNKGHTSHNKQQDYNAKRGVHALSVWGKVQAFWQSR
jgi:hypothetical protein